MKLLSIFLGLLIGNAHANELTTNQISLLAEEAQSFRKDCLDAGKIHIIKEMIIANKTVGYLDKKEIKSLLMKNLNLKVDAKGTATLMAQITSSSREADHVRATKYEIKLSLDDGAKTGCKSSYFIETKESRN